jgi:hypothetical protein
VKDQPEIAFEAHANSLAQSPQLDNLAAFSVGDWWDRCAQQKGRGNREPLECFIEDALLEGFDVDGDVWKLGHCR